MADFRAWRDKPKPGETDAGWCASKAIDGHVQLIVQGYSSEGDALRAVEVEGQEGSQ